MDPITTHSAAGILGTIAGAVFRSYAWDFVIAQAKKLYSKFRGK
jgi:hypothetical protein